jgi:hypothetical protein
VIDAQLDVTPREIFDFFLYAVDELLVVQGTLLYIIGGRRLV